MAAAWIGPGDEVITSPITDMGTVIGMLYQQGSRSSPTSTRTYTLDPADVHRRLTRRPRRSSPFTSRKSLRPDGLKALAESTTWC